MTWTSVDNWLDLVDHVWIGLVLIITAVVPSVFAARNHNKIKETQRVVSQVRDQVINNHGDTPLRDDIDRLTAATNRIEDKITQLREDDANERQVRRTEINELREDVDARFRALNRRMD